MILDLCLHIHIHLDVNSLKPSIYFLNGVDKSKRKIKKMFWWLKIMVNGEREGKMEMEVMEVEVGEKWRNGTKKFMWKG